MFKIWKKYSCNNCWKDCIYWEWARIVYCQSWESFYQQIACSTECYNILDDAWLNPKVNTCQICKNKFSDSETYEYRWFMFCKEHFDEWQEKVDYKRKEVMETVEATTKSQRAWEFINNHKKYNIWNVASDWLPVIKIKEPQILQDYENWIL